MEECDGKSKLSKLALTNLGGGSTMKLKIQETLPNIIRRFNFYEETSKENYGNVQTVDKMVLGQQS